MEDLRRSDGHFLNAYNAGEYHPIDTTPINFFDTNYTKRPIPNLDTSSASIDQLKIRVAFLSTGLQAARQKRNNFEEERLTTVQTWATENAEPAKTNRTEAEKVYDVAMETKRQHERVWECRLWKFKQEII